MDEIGEILDDYHNATLREMALQAGIDVLDADRKKLTKAALAERMRAEYFTRERVLASLARLNERERAVLDRLLLRGAAAPTRTLRREAERAGLVTVTQARGRWTRHGYAPSYADSAYVGDPGRRSSTDFRDVVARLTMHGLVFSQATGPDGNPTPYKLRFNPGGLLYVPQIIRRYLPEPEPIAPDVPDWEPEQIEPADPEPWLRDLYLYWDYCRRNDVPLLKSGLVGKRAMRAINDQLLVADPTLDDARTEEQTGRLYLLRLLLQRLDLVKRQSGRLCPTQADPLAVPPFWTWPRQRQCRACLEAWSDLTVDSGLEKDVSQFSPHPGYARSVVLDLLRTQPAGVWLELDEFAEQVRDQDPDFLLANHSYVESYGGDYIYGRSVGSHYSGYTKDLLRRFDHAERRFVRETITSFVAELGLIDLGRTGGQSNAFRLTEEGRALVRGEEVPPPSAPETGKLVVQPSFQVLALGPVSFAWLARLDLFAEREQADRGAFAYRLTRDSIYRAQQVNLDVPEVVRFLEQASGAELPQNIFRSLAEWGAGYERMVFRSGASLLQAADPALLARLISDPQVGGYLARTLSPEVALVRKRAEEPLIAALVRLGQLPAVSGAEPEAADKSVLVHEDGTIRAIHAVPSLHLRARLDRLAEETGEGRWQLTARSVRRAGGSKARVLRLLEELHKLHRGILPPALEEQIKAWGGYYGRAAVDTLTLIEFRDQETLDELRQQPDLQGYLTPFPAGDRALATVPRNKLAEVEDILARFGVPLRDGLPEQ